MSKIVAKFAEYQDNQKITKALLGKTYTVVVYQYDFNNCKKTLITDVMKALEYSETKPETWNQLRLLGVVQAAYMEYTQNACNMEVSSQAMSGFCKCLMDLLRDGNRDDLMNGSSVDAVGAMKFTNEVCDGFHRMILDYFLENPHNFVRK